MCRDSRARRAACCVRPRDGCSTSPRQARRFRRRQQPRPRPQAGSALTALLPAANAPCRRPSSRCCLVCSPFGPPRGWATAVEMAMGLAEAVGAPRAAAARAAIPVGAAAEVSVRGCSPFRCRSRHSPPCRTCTGRTTRSTSRPAAAAAKRSAELPSCSQCRKGACRCVRCTTPHSQAAVVAARN